MRGSITLASRERRLMSDVVSDYSPGCRCIKSAQKEMMMAVSKELKQKQRTPFLPLDELEMLHRIGRSEGGGVFRTRLRGQKPDQVTLVQVIPRKRFHTVTVSSKNAEKALELLSRRHQCHRGEIELTDQEVQKIDQQLNSLD